MYNIVLKYLKSLFTVLAFALSILQVNAQIKVKLQGTVTDSLTSEKLSGASVYVKQQAVGVETSRDGEYLLQLPAGEHRISISFVGYKTKEVIVNVQNNTVMNFALIPVSASLDAAVVSAEKTNVNVMRSETGIERLQMKQIRLIPALMGEVDILKAIRMLPGVQATSEGSSSFSVRGGSPDQNLILFDEATVYNASHLMGFFSVFNNDAVEDLKLYKGDIPPIYGGRLSSLLAVSSHELSANKFTGTGGIGTISSRLAIEAPIGNNLSVFGAGRRTYADLFLKMMPDKDIRDVKLYFYDLNGKVNWRINAKNRLFVSAYDGKDRFKNENMYMNFGNRTLTLRWNSLFSEKFFMNLTATNSEYNYNIGSTNESLLGNWIAKTYDWGLKSDFTWLANSNNTFKFGISAIYHVFHPGDATAVINKEDYGVYLPHSQAVNWAIYASNEQKISSRITLRYGLRAALFQNVGPGKVFANIYDSRGNPEFNHYSSGDFFNNYWTIEPRAGLVYAFNEATSFKANYSRSSQFLHLLSTSTSGSPLDVWIPSNPNIKPQTANQFSAGIFRNFLDDTYETSLEGYYKNYDNVIDFKDHPNIFAREVIESELRMGTGKSYGLEFMIRKNSGRLTGWFSYTWSRTLRTVELINSGKPYSSPYDRPNNINIVLNYELTPRITLGTTWVYSSGQPVTFPEGRYLVGNDYIPIYSGRNNYRMPAYHRMDISATFNLDKRKNKRWKNELNVSIYNLYGRKNPWMINFHTDTDGSQYAEMTYLFWIVPSITYNFKF